MSNRSLRLATLVVTLCVAAGADAGPKFERPPGDITSKVKVGDAFRDAVNNKEPAKKVETPTKPRDPPPGSQPKPPWTPKF